MAQVDKAYKSGYKNIILKTDSKQLCISVASVCAKLQLNSYIYLDSIDDLTIFKLKLLGSNIIDANYENDEAYTISKESVSDEIIKKELKSQIDSFDILLTPDDVESFEHQDILDAFKLLARCEGIIASFESVKPIAYLMKHRDAIKGKKIVVVLEANGESDIVDAFEMLSL
ncbi:MAG: hypothetical protein JXQ66_04215, partial [Campylobacterales bacterium]|nr:hypothetical protein [Campylobacterales bacterium]